MYACITPRNFCFCSFSASVSFDFETRIMSICMSTSRSNYIDMSIWKTTCRPPALIIARYNCCEEWNVDTIMIQYLWLCWKTKEFYVLTFPHSSANLRSHVSDRLTIINVQRWLSSLCQHTHDTISRADKTFHIQTPLEGEWYIFKVYGMRFFCQSYLWLWVIFDRKCWAV